MWLVRLRMRVALPCALGGRFREFYQADIDVIGDGQLSIVNEAEIPSIIYRAFTALGLKRFRVGP